MVELILPQPHAKQAEIIYHPAKRKVIVAGRRSGKTTLAAIMAVNRILKEQKVLITSTTQDQADVFWYKITEWLHPLFGNGVMTKNESRRIIFYKKGGRTVGSIRVKTGSKPDVLKGGDADLIIFDECAMLDPAAWYEVGAPMLADRNGTAVFLSTPKRRNWFYHLYNQCQQPDKGNWQAWHFTTHDNIYLSAEAVDELTVDMTDESYDQEILAKFLANSGSAFNNVEKCAVLPVLKSHQLGYTTHSEPYTSDFMFGVDLGRHKDHTVIVVFDVRSKSVVAYWRFTGLNWSLQRARIRRIAHEWNPMVIVVEKNSFGDPNIEELQKMGLPIRAFAMTASSKPSVMHKLQLELENQNIKLLDDVIMKGELTSYEQSVNPKTNYISFGAPDGVHDDIVVALALAVWEGIHTPEMVTPHVRGLYDDRPYEYHDSTRDYGGVGLIGLYDD